MKIFPHDDRYQILINLLRLLRKEKGLNQSDVATKLKCPQSYVSKYENAERRLDPVELYIICDALEISYVDFAKKYDLELKKTKNK